MGSHIVYIFCVEFQTLDDKTAQYFDILTNMLSEVFYEPINVGLSIKI
jgi:hypothetical protein